MDTPLQQDLAVAVTAAREGTRAIRPWLGRLQGAEFKGEVDPVTAADRQSETVIIATIKAARPDDAILAEESGGDTLCRGRGGVNAPPDGTLDFLHGVPHVSVSGSPYER